MGRTPSHLENTGEQCSGTKDRFNDATHSTLADIAKVHCIEPMVTVEICDLDENTTIEEVPLQYTRARHRALHIVGAYL